MSDVAETERDVVAMPQVLSNPVISGGGEGTGPSRPLKHADSVGFANAMNHARLSSLSSKHGPRRGNRKSSASPSVWNRGSSAGSRDNSDLDASKVVAFKKTSSLLSSFGFSKSDSKGNGGGMSAASRNADFQQTSEVSSDGEHKMRMPSTATRCSYCANLSSDGLNNCFLATRFARRSSQAHSVGMRTPGLNTTPPKGTTTGRNSSTSPRRGILPGRSPKAPS